MILYKTIIQGRLEFGNQKSYDKVFKMFMYKYENYYKSDIILEPEEIFEPETFTLNVPRYVGQNLEKSWRNMISLIEYSGQFAVSGEFRAWQTDNGKIINYGFVEPQSEKIAVIHFRKGRELAFEKGKEEEALEALGKAIEKYDKHAQAYEIRGRVNYILQNNHEALRDYNKCINIDPSIPYAYYGMAVIQMNEEKYEEAIVNLDLAIKKAVALQSIYWKARRRKAICHYKRGELEKAAFDLKLLSNRKFKEGDPNYGWRRYSNYQYGIVLTELGQHKEAIPCFEAAYEIKDGKDNIADGDILAYVGMSKKMGGKSGFTKDFKKAIELGSEIALTFQKMKKK